MQAFDHCLPFDIQLKNITLYTIYWKLTSGYCEKKQHSSSRSSNTLWSKNKNKNKYKYNYPIP